MEPFDFVVAGGGMVGAATAIGLAQQGFRVAVVESHHLSHFIPLSLPISESLQYHLTLSLYYSS